MPKEAVYRFTCERCGREWFSSAANGEPATAIARLLFRDAAGVDQVSSSYDVLCEGCAKTVGNYLGQVTKELRKTGAKRKSPKCSKTIPLPPPEVAAVEKLQAPVRPVTPPPTVPRR